MYNKKPWWNMAVPPLFHRGAWSIYSVPSGRNDAPLFNEIKVQTI